MASATRTSAGGSGLGGSPLQDALKDFPSLPRSSRSLSLRADRSAPGGRPAMPVLIAAWSLGPSTRKATRANTPVRWHPRGALRRPACLHQGRSEEHTSELQSRLHLVCRLLLEKKKNKTDITVSP